MKKTFLLILVSLWALFPVQAQNLIPEPLEQIPANGLPFRLTAKTRVVYFDASLSMLANQLVTDIQQMTGFKLKIAPFKASSGDIVLQLDAAHDLLPQNHTTYGVSAQSPEGVDERYAVNVQATQIRLVGASLQGVTLATATLRQMLAQSLEVPAQLIQDAPLLAWRGLSLDCSRHFWEVSEVQKVLDMMSLYKLNVLHLHLTDNQGWRLQVNGYPELTAQGGSYSQADYQQILSYAERRGITLVPELDIPGHTQAVFNAYPQLPNAAKSPLSFDLPGQAIAALDPSDEATLQLVQTALAQLAALTPGRYIHVGGDETFGMNEEKYLHFIEFVRRYVHTLGKQVIGWQEMARAEVEEGDILQNWISFSKKQIFSKSSNENPAAQAIPDEVKQLLSATYLKAPKDLQTAKEKRVRVLLSPSAFCYLDCPYEEQSRDPDQAEQRQNLGLQQYARQNLQDMYEWNPLTYSSVLSSTDDLVGVEAAIWCETIGSFQDLQFLMLPRLTGVAEKAWCPQEKAQWESYRQRLASQSRVWRNLKWNFFQSEMIDWE